MDWFTLLIACGLLMAVIAVMTVMEVAYEQQGQQEEQVNLPNTSRIGYDNTVIIKTDNNIIAVKNEATEYARSLLISSLLEDKHDSIKQYIPVHLYSKGQDITDRFEYHSLVEVKTLAIAVRLLLVNNNPEYLHIDQLIVKSQEWRDLFIINLQQQEQQVVEVQPFQRLYIVWYIQLAADNVTEAGISQLLQALAYSTSTTQYKHSLLKDIVLMDSSGNILPFYPLMFNVEKNEGNYNYTYQYQDQPQQEQEQQQEHKLTITAILKNNTAKDLKVKTIAVRNSNLEYIFAYDLEEEMEARAYSKVTVKVEVWS